MASLRFHPDAQAEYDSALAWYQARSPRAAARFENEVDRLLAQVCSTPELFPSYDADHRFAVLRRFPYSIVYLVQPGDILIVAVAHSSRAASYWRGRG